MHGGSEDRSRSRTNSADLLPHRRLDLLRTYCCVVGRVGMRHGHVQIVFL